MQFLLGAFLMVGACAFYDDAFKIAIGSFTVSPYDFFFVVLCIYFLYFVFNKTRRITPPRYKNIKNISLLGLAYVLIIPFVRRTDYAFSDVARDWRVVVYLVAVPLLMQSIVSTRADLDRFQICLRLAALFVVFRFLISFFEFRTSTFEAFRSATLGIWMLPFSIISVLLFEYRLKDPMMRVLNWVLVFASVLVVVLSLNRSQYLQLAASVLLIYAFGYLRRSASIKAFFFLMAIILLLIPLLSYIGYNKYFVERVSTFRGFQNEVSVGSRIEEANKQLEMFYESKILGKGPGYKSLVTGPTGWEESVFAHNSIVYYLVKFGIVGSLLILLSPVLIIISIFRAKISDSFLVAHKRFFLMAYLPYLAIDTFSAAWSFSQKALFSGMLLGYVCSILRLNEVVRQSWAKQVRLSVGHNETSQGSGRAAI
jgi:O-antigen ligase